MYTSFFNLRENPFSLTPDPRYLYLSPQHREALNHLIYGIHEKKGFILVTGGIGTGKTTLCRALLTSLDPSVETALILNPFQSDIELLVSILKEFGIPLEGMERTKTSCIEALNAFLLKNFSLGKNAAILIDEAQNLPGSTLEQIRMLSNLETEKEKLLQIVLIGQPELRDILASHPMRQINDRIVIRVQLGPLSRESVGGYIGHRLAIAGANGSLSFTDGAVEKIYDFSRGYPRRINAICDRALLVAYTEGTRLVDSDTVRNALKDMNEGHIADTTKNSLSWRRLAIFYALGVFTVLLVAGIMVYLTEIPGWIRTFRPF